jgi:hypothetical protein
MASSRVIGYTEFMRAIARAGKDEKKYVRDVFREVGNVVRADAAARFTPYDEKTARGYRVYVRQRGIGVEQSLRKTTGAHPEFGSLQMRRALLPAVDDAEPFLDRGMERALTQIERHFEEGH